jgi:putative chitinase
VKQVEKSLAHDVMNYWANAARVEDALDQVGFKPQAKANVLANLEAESNFNPRREEVPSSKSAEELKRTFRALRNMSDEDIDKLKKDPKKFFETVYGKDTNKGKQLSNTEPGDGYKFRGGGIIQITGRSAYQAIGELLGMKDEILANPDLLNTPEIASKAVVAFFSWKNRSPTELLDMDVTRDTINAHLDEEEVDRRSALLPVFQQLVNDEERAKILKEL